MLAQLESGGGVEQEGHTSAEHDNIVFGGDIIHDGQTRTQETVEQSGEISDSSNGCRKCRWEVGGGKMRRQRGGRLGCGEVG